MTRDDMDSVLAEHVAAVHRAQAAGFDMIEMHAAHGYLLSSFITPVLNHREDEYGGSLENRLRYPLEVCQAMRLPGHRKNRCPCAFPRTIGWAIPASLKARRY